MFTWREYYNKVYGYWDRIDAERILIRQVVTMLSNTGNRKYLPSEIYPLNSDLHVDPRAIKAEEDIRERGIELAKRMGLKLPEDAIN